MTVRDEKTFGLDMEKMLRKPSWEDSTTMREQADTIDMRRDEPVRWKRFQTVPETSVASVSPSGLRRASGSAQLFVWSNRKGSIERGEIQVTDFILLHGACQGRRSDD